VRPAYPDWFREWPGKEAGAVALRSFEPLIVPGLLQTVAAGVAAARAAWEATKSEALPRSASLDLIEKVAEQWT
jgi:hypothetical protein